jgi:glutaredoxin-related protein
MDAKEQEALAALALANEQASQIKQLTASVAGAMDAKEQEALAALALANEQASQIKQLTASVAAAMDAKEQVALAALALANEQASQIKQLTASVAAAMDAKEQEALAALALANEQASQIEQLELQLIEAQEHGTLALRAREALEETLRQKEGEFEDAKAGFEIEVKKLLQDQSEIILRGRAAEDKITNLNQALDAEIQEKASIQSICSELDGRVSELTSELAALREREALVVQARKELDDALRQKEAEFEDAKAGFEVEVKKLLQDQNEIILRGRAAEDQITNLNQALDAEIQEKASVQSLCSELDGRVSELTSELAALREREALVVQARKELDDALRQKEAEFESAKAGFDFEVTKLLQEQNEIILRGRAAEDKITELNQYLDAQIEEKASIQSLYSELNSRISELANELTDLRSREQVLMQAQHDLEIAEVHNKALTDKVDTLRNRVQEGGLLAEKNLLELKQHFSAHVPPQQYQALVRQTEELRKRVEAMDAELVARDMMVSDLTDLVRLQAAQLEHQAS